MIEIKKDDFYTQLQRNIASLSIDISILRNQSKAGSVKYCRDFCAENIKIVDFFQALRWDYLSWLDLQTKRLLNDQPSLEIQFGSARKVLNIFLKNISNNGMFQSKYLKSENFIANNGILSPLEIPIDSRVVEGIKKHIPSTKDLTSIKSLTEAQHSDYQNKALLIGNNNGIARVHLDMYFWTPETKKL